MIKAEFMVKLIGAQDNKGAKDSLMEQYKNNLGHAEDISYHTPKLNALMAELIGADASSNVVSQVLFTGVSAQAFDLSAFLDDGKAASVSSRLSNVSFDKADYDDRTRAYMDFEAKFLDDLELIVKSNPDCGDSECRPLAEIADVDFISGSRKLLESDVEITSNIYNVDGRETVKAINDRCANSCMLGGMTTEEGAVSVKEGAAEPVTGGEPVTGDDGGSSGAASKAFAFGSTFFFAMLVAMMV
ncbi:hypothetical protein DUNSADRAFT_6286 [Dunaliella salina]|uniref:Uncharacterized protein n=1 Tax=Dunaliella salina TaxID=3046 RepID=A0ABQ7GNK8_DUNSA|nr:hypothetical protein DUNSADRAFT_6286 [Dunaliella salina]|eukprot:KAF5836177.1 hypothetical protein DUNSADRAFT_6286 [Dunaliella salina]